MSDVASRNSIRSIIQAIRSYEQQPERERLQNLARLAPILADAVEEREHAIDVLMKFLRE